MRSFDLSAFLPYQLAVAAARVSKQFSDRYRAEFGLSIPEWRVLGHLAGGDAVSVSEIHARGAIGKSKGSRAAGRLEGWGLREKRADQVVSEAVEIMENIRDDGLFHELETGQFGGIKRRRVGGKGLDGVVAKGERYDNPFVELFLAEQQREQK